MVTMAILEQKMIMIPDNHYTMVIFPGAEDYNTLKSAMASFLQELRELATQGITITNIHWKINLYFSSDWKFLAICLGINAAKSNYFCPWCTIKKSQQGDLSLMWTISKNINMLKDNCNAYPGHYKPPLFDMIPIDHWIFDELHVMLRITDQLWSLVLHELIEEDLFDDVAREVITTEMYRIGVRFHFWKERDNDNWKYTSLMGNDKVKMLQQFNLDTILAPSRARQIRHLWNRFFDLYLVLRNLDTDPNVFSINTQEWLTEFLTTEHLNDNGQFVRSLYMPSDITPYMHVLVYHGPELMRIHSHWGLGTFSCEPVEKKNHQQVSYFFTKTMKDGGKLQHRKLAIEEIMEYENRNLYYCHNQTSLSYTKPQKIRIL